MRRSSSAEHSAIDRLERTVAQKFLQSVTNMPTHCDEKPRVREHVEVENQKVYVGKDQRSQRRYFTLEVQDVEDDLNVTRFFCYL